MLWIVGSRRGPWRSALKPGYCWVHFFRCWLDVSRKLLNREVNQLGLRSGHRPGNDPRQPAREIPTAGLEDGRERWPQAFLHERSDYTDYTLFFSHHRTPTWKPHMRMASKDYQKMVSWKKHDMNMWKPPFSCVRVLVVCRSMLSSLPMAPVNGVDPVPLELEVWGCYGIF